MALIFIAIFVLAMVLAYISMSDFEAPKSVRNIVNRRKKRGTILFLNKKIKHYSSSSESSSSDE